MMILVIKSFGQNYYFDTTIVIRNHNYRILTSEINDDFITMTVFSDSERVSIDTINSLGLSDLQFIDFNKDNNSDILLSYLGNNMLYYLYLFDSQSNRFINVEAFSKYPESNQLKNQNNLYYSYHRAGCADMNWVSDLYTIVDFKAVHLGCIYGQGCDYEVDENSQIIEVFKIIDDDSTNSELIEKLPYLEYIPYFGYKWDFIENYWNENYPKFD